MAIYQLPDSRNDRLGSFLQLSMNLLNKKSMQEKELSETKDQREAITKYYNAHADYYTNVKPQIDQANAQGKAALEQKRQLELFKTMGENSMAAGDSLINTDPDEAMRMYANANIFKMAATGVPPEKISGPLMQKAATSSANLNLLDDLLETLNKVSPTDDEGKESASFREWQNLLLNAKNHVKTGRGTTPLGDLETSFLSWGAANPDSIEFFQELETGRTGGDDWIPFNEKVTGTAWDVINNSSSFTSAINTQMLSGKTLAEEMLAYNGRGSASLKAIVSKALGSSKKPAAISHNETPTNASSEESVSDERLEARRLLGGG